LTPKSRNRRLSAKKVALTASFAPLYTLMSMWKVFPVIGLPDHFIDGSTFISPVFGLLLGPEIGFLAVAVGGLINLSIGQIGIFGPLSFLPHAATALQAGMLKRGKRVLCTAIYLFLFLFFAFYPVVGPFWVWPQMLWLHLVALFILASPLQAKAARWLLEAESPWKLVIGVFVTVFTSVLFGHLVGSTVFEVMYWQAIVNQPIWQILTFQYAFERITMALVATVIGVPLIKALKSYNFGG